MGKCVCIFIHFERLIKREGEDGGASREGGGRSGDSVNVKRGESKTDDDKKSQQMRAESETKQREAKGSRQDKDAEQEDDKQR